MIALTYGSEESAWTKARTAAKRLEAAGQLKESEAEFLIAVKHARNVQATNPGHLAETLLDLAEVYQRQGKLEPAKKEYLAAIGIATEMLSHPQGSELYKGLARLSQTQAYTALGKLYTEQKDYKAATATFEAGLKMDGYRSTIYPAVAELKRAYADMLDQEGHRPELAKQMRQQANDAAEGMFGDL